MASRLEDENIHVWIFAVGQVEEIALAQKRAALSSEENLYSQVHKQLPINPCPAYGEKGHWKINCINEKVGAITVNQSDTFTKCAEIQSAKIVRKEQSYVSNLKHLEHVVNRTDRTQEEKVATAETVPSMIKEGAERSNKKAKGRQKQKKTDTNFVLKRQTIQHLVENVGGQKESRQ